VEEGLRQAADPTVWKGGRPDAIGYDGQPNCLYLFNDTLAKCDRLVSLSLALRISAMLTCPGKHLNRLIDKLECPLQAVGVLGWDNQCQVS
jgi:hypothetical protein